MLASGPQQQTMVSDLIVRQGPQWLTRFTRQGRQLADDVKPWFRVKVKLF